MKIALRWWSVFAAGLMLACGASSQVLTLTYNTFSAWDGSVFYFEHRPVGPSGPIGTYSQTVSGVNRVNYIDYAFVTTFTAPNLGPVQWAFGEWNAGQEAISNVLTSGTVTPAASDFDRTIFIAGRDVYYSSRVFDLSAFLLDPTKTYSFTFTAPATYTFGLGASSFTQTFPLGTAYMAGHTLLDADYMMHSISVSFITAIPESGSVAGVAAGLFVGFLVARRRWVLRRARESQLHTRA